MNVSLELYKIFYFVAQQSSITKAAQHLNVSQPAVTKQIKKLENLLEVKLITKNSKGIELTEDGQRLYNMLDDSISNLMNIESVYKDKNNKKIYNFKIVASNSVMQIFLSKKIIEFNKKFPNIKFSIYSDRHPEAIQKLRNGEVDLIFINKKRYVKTYSDIIVTECFDTNDILVVNYDNRDKYPTKIKIKDINKYPLICIDVPTVAKEKIEEILNQNNEVFNPKYIVNQELLTLAYAKDDLGIGLVTKECAKNDLDNHTLSQIDTDIEFPKRKICYAIRKNSIGYTVLQDFISKLKNNN